MTRDPAVWDEKVAQIWQFLDQKRFNDALDLSTQLTVQDSKNADGWWPLAVAAKGLERWEDARLAAVETIKLLPTSPVIWGTYGEILEAQSKDEEAKKAYEKAIKIKPNYLFGHWRLLTLCKNADDYDGIITHGQFLERNSEVGAGTLDDIGIAFWYKNNFRMSLQYYKKSVLLEKLSFRFSNLGLIYERSEIAQDLNASDAYRRALILDPNNEKAKEARLRIKQRFSIINQDSSLLSAKILTDEKFYRFYINPYVLLGYDPNDCSDDYSEKGIQKRRKLLLHEIDLEGGSVQTLAGHIVDKSQAISLCDELFDESKKRFNWIVFQDGRLVNFLQKGDASLFFLDDEYFPQATLEALDGQDFLDWISPMFAAQYNLVFSQAIEKSTVSAISLLLGGRRYVTQDDEDNCFVGASRILNHRMDLIRNAAKDAAAKRPSIKNINEIFARLENAPPLGGLLLTGR
jgi:tetratricopeptide (TPR) repeat protein